MHVKGCNYYVCKLSQSCQLSLCASPIFHFLIWRIFNLLVYMYNYTCRSSCILPSLVVTFAINITQGLSYPTSYNMYTWPRLHLVLCTYGDCSTIPTEDRTLLVAQVFTYTTLCVVNDCLFFSTGCWWLGKTLCMWRVMLVWTRYFTSHNGFYPGWRNLDTVPRWQSS